MTPHGKRCQKYCCCEHCGCSQILWCVAFAGVRCRIARTDKWAVKVRSATRLWLATALQTIVLWFLLVLLNGKEDCTIEKGKWAVRCNMECLCTYSRRAAQAPPVKHPGSCSVIYDVWIFFQIEFSSGTSTGYIYYWDASVHNRDKRKCRKECNS